MARTLTKKDPNAADKKEAAPAKAATPAKAKGETVLFTYAVLSAIRFDGKRREAGATVDMSENMAAPLLADGLLSADLPELELGSQDSDTTE